MPDERHQVGPEPDAGTPFVPAGLQYSDKLYEDALHDVLGVMGGAEHLRILHHRRIVQVEEAIPEMLVGLSVRHALNERDLRPHERDASSCRHLLPRAHLALLQQ